jgi:CRP-like cAMP-binding protein
MVTPTKPVATSSSGKSGMRIFKSGEVIFNGNDPAESLFIIQKGQVRLFLPKGKGFVELAILRTGEVIGEMAYFDESSRRRSCSASAMVQTEVIEISFVAFAKTMESLNPWFKTIINTLANRLRKTNDRVKELESNSVGFAVGGKVADYKFLQNLDVVRILSVLYFCFATMSEKKNDLFCIHIDKIKVFIFEIFGIQEVKFEEFHHLLQTEIIIDIAVDENLQPKVLTIKDPEILKEMMLFLNTQRNLADGKKSTISNKCEYILAKIIAKLDSGELNGNALTVDVDVTGIIEQAKKEDGVVIEAGDLQDATKARLCGESSLNDKNRFCTKVEVARLRRMYPQFKLQNAIAKFNDTKASGGTKS